MEPKFKIRLMITYLDPRVTMGDIIEVCGYRNYVTNDELKKFVPLLNARYGKSDHV